MLFSELKRPQIRLYISSNMLSEGVSDFQIRLYISLNMLSEGVSNLQQDQTLYYIISLSLFRYICIKMLLVFMLFSELK